ncbi:MAG TPA: hypothetical protein DEQ20_00595 [Desulfobulbaceae bacterium]|nr:MAG: hypothetical protein A2520_00070 [Deltaproteobacteria bacterium RIFOXYD12_FULL_53_23]HCC53417.1 hypothetical protein [Desulfobulbaceae bacterium]
MSKKPGLTLNQHDAIGLKLQTMRDDLGLLACVLDVAYPRKPSAAHDLAGQAQAIIDRLRGKLDEKVFQQHWDFKRDLLTGIERDKELRRLFVLYKRSGREDYQPAEARNHLWQDVLEARHRNTQPLAVSK